MWEDNWIPRNGACYPVGYKDRTGISRVSDLDNQGRNWCHATLDRVFHENDRGYQTSGGRGTGKGIFLGIELHKKWDFFSAYHLSVQLKKRGTDSAECSNAVKAHKGWLDLRSTEVPGKVKIHVWRLA